MKKIPLTQNQYALVDDADYEELSKHKWYAQWDHHTHSFYARRRIYLPNGTRAQESMHRHILGLERGDSRQGDHLNRKTLDNRRSNIRIVTQIQNQHNTLCGGYGWHKQHKKYRARIGVNGVDKHLGLFDTPDEARAAYLAAKRIYHPSAPLPK
jgi:hypothetical protein